MSSNIVHAPSLTGLANTGEVDLDAWIFDPVGFGHALLRAMERRKLSCREAAREIGISAPTVNRVTRGYPPSVEAYLRIRRWFNEPSAAAHETAREPNPSSEQVIAELCEALEDAKGTFEHIADYWNRDANEDAMKDACWMAINEASEAAKIIDEALSKARGAAG